MTGLEPPTLPDSSPPPHPRWGGRYPPALIAPALGIRSFTQTGTHSEHSWGSSYIFTVMLFRGVFLRPSSSACLVSFIGYCLGIYHRGSLQHEEMTAEEKRGEGWRRGERGGEEGRGGESCRSWPWSLSGRVIHACFRRINILPLLLYERRSVRLSKGGTSLFLLMRLRPVVWGTWFQVTSSVFRCAQP